MRNRLKGLMVLGVAASVACSSTATEAPEANAGARLGVFVPEAGVTLARQDFSGMTARERLVVRDAQAWTAVWARIRGAIQPPPGVIQPDFGEEMAIVAAMGEKPTGGHWCSSTA